MATSKEKQYCDLLTPVVCDECDGQNDVINYCLQCNANICGKCKITHCNTRLHREHIVLPRTHQEVLKARRSKKVYCPTHPGQEFVTYCRKCKTPCCAKCITEKHNGHKFLDLEKIIAKTELEVDTTAHELEANLIPMYEQAIAQLDDITSYERNIVNIKLYSKERLGELINELQEKHEEFLTEVDGQWREDLEIIKRRKQYLEENLEKVKSAVDRAKTAPIDASILLISDELSRVSSLKPRKITCPGELCFIPSDVLISSLPGIIGRTYNCSEKVIFKSSAENHDTVTKGSNFDFLTMENKVLKRINDICAQSIMNCPNKEMWINTTAGCVEVYDKDLNLAKQKNMIEHFSCDDMVLYGSNDLIAIDTDKRWVVRISSSGSITLLFSFEHYATGICVNNKQEIVVATGYDEVCDMRVFLWKLIVYSPDGSIRLKMRHDICSDNIHHDCFEVKQTPGGDYVVVTDNEVTRLSLYMDSDSDVKWTYTFEPHQYQRTLGGLYCDGYNNILVGDRQMHEIVMLNMDGQRVRTLLNEEDGIWYPLSMNVDSEGRLWIGQSSNILIATYLK
ncbi:hypothetical protein FSP39_004455 [Pinctada imbricata]|uniref:B box-type domain-containing protein n=1 Tax=Pinctada imbricata TaxID=66713 RepID=A0AA88XVD4_PINIB|nr:hypothetical protein FSP39_004455 [Pinctada imbricata]